MSEETKVPTPRELLKEKADLLGVEYKNNVTDAKLQEMIEAKQGKAVEAEVVKTDAEIVAEATAEQRKRLTKLVRCVITCMDPKMKDWDTTPPLSLSNSILTVDKMVIPLNVEWHVPQWYYEMLKDQMCTISVKGKDLKGRPTTIQKEIKKYGFQMLEPLTIEEIQELKTMQIMRDGVKTE